MNRTRDVLPTVVPYLKRVLNGHARKYVVQSITLAILSVVMLLIQPFLISKIINIFGVQTSVETFKQVGLLCVAMIVAAVVNFALASANNKLLQAIRFESKYELISFLVAERASLLFNKSGAWLESSISQASHATRFVVHESINALVRVIAFVALSTFLMISVSPVFGFIYAVGAMLYLFLTYRTAHASSAIVADAVTATNRLSEEVADVFTNIDVIHQSGMHSAEIDRMKEHLAHEQTIYSVVQHVIDNSQFYQRLFLSGLFVIFVASGAAIHSGAESIASVVFIYIVGLLAHNQLENTGEKLNTVFENVNRIRAALSDLDYQPSLRGIRSKSSVLPASASSCDILLKNIDFNYDESRKLFRDFSIEINSGSRIVIRGPSGSGKSTLLNLIAGRIQQKNGVISVAAVNQATVHEWRHSLFGIKIDRYANLSGAISTWPEFATCVAVRLEADDSLDIICPHSLEELFNMVVRWNPNWSRKNIFWAASAARDTPTAGPNVESSALNGATTPCYPVNASRRRLRLPGTGAQVSLRVFSRPRTQPAYSANKFFCREAESPTDGGDDERREHGAC